MNQPQNKSREGETASGGGQAGRWSQAGEGVGHGGQLAEGGVGVKSGGDEPHPPPGPHVPGHAHRPREGTGSFSSQKREGIKAVSAQDRHGLRAGSPWLVCGQQVGEGLMRHCR